MKPTDPTLVAPMPASTIDFAAIFQAENDRRARREALLPANKECLFDGLAAAGISHVIVAFDGYGDSGQIESIEAFAGETVVAFPNSQIAYTAQTWDAPEFEERALTLEAVVEQLAYDFLSDTHGGWENNEGAYGEFCFDANARTIHLEFNERFTSSELYTHAF